MKEIKFRAWDDVLLKYYQPMTIKELAMSDMRETNWYQLTIEQYTGLKDKNGIDIYEGDIVKNTYGKLEKVVFVNGSFQCASIKHPSLNLYLLDTYSNHIEVIGNIHEENEYDK